MGFVVTVGKNKKLIKKEEIILQNESQQPN
jgi:hypothetical protein